MKRLVCMCVLLLTLPACGKTMATATTAPQLTPQARVLYNLTQVVDAIGTLQLAAENANANGMLTNAASRTIVQFCVDANGAIAKTPNGWLAVVNTAYASAKGTLSPTDLAKFGPYLSTFELVLTGFSPTGAH